MNNIDRNRLKERLGIKQDENPLVAFEKNPCAKTLSRISKRVQTLEMVRRAIENDSNEASGVETPFSPPILKYVSQKLITQELCLLALKKSGTNILYVPEKLLDRSMYMAAVNNCSFMLKYLPDETPMTEKSHYILQRI